MRVKLPEPVARIYRTVAELEARYHPRKLTPDAHLVGSIGEVVAAEALGCPRQALVERPGNPLARSSTCRPFPWSRRQAGLRLAARHQCPSWVGKVTRFSGIRSQSQCRAVQAQTAHPNRDRHSRRSDDDPFDFVQSDLVVGAVVKLRRPYRFVRGDLLRLFDRAAV